MKRAIRAAAAGSLVAMIVVLSSCSGGAPETAYLDPAASGAGLKPERVRVEAAALATLGLTYASAEVRDFTPALDLPAEIVVAPDRVASLTPPVAGRIVSVRVNSGDRVRKGDVLAVLSSTDVGNARAAVIAARARSEAAARAATRAENLRLARVGSVRAVEEAAAARAVAEAELLAAMTRVRAYGVRDEIVEADDPSTVALVAPIGGMVAARNATTGQWAEASDQLVEIVNLDTVWVLAMVYERDMRFVSPGQEVQVQVRAFPGETFVGRVEQIASQLDESTRAVPVRVVLRNDAHRLRPGMFASARILGTHAHEARELLTIPWAAVQELDGHHIVFVRDDESVFEPRRLHTGERSGELVEILSGLRLGEQVVVDGSVLLKAQLLRTTLGEEE